MVTDYREALINESIRRVQQQVEDDIDSGVVRYWPEAWIPFLTDEDYHNLAVNVLTNARITKMARRN